MGLFDWIIGEDIIFLVLVVVLCSVLIAGIKYIKSKGGKVLFIAIVGSAIAYLITRLL